jgi:hypothetical protein
MEAGMKHGQPIAAWPDTIDPYGARVSANMEEYLVLEAAFCSCDALCTCGWDDIEESGELSEQKPLTIGDLCSRCEGDGWVEVFNDEGFPVGARDCDACGGSGLEAK